MSRLQPAEATTAADQHQPIHLYVMPAGVDSPAWINGVCNVYDGGPDTVVQEPLASGTADLKERISVMADGDREVVDVFNSVNGTAVGSNGTHYKIRASADLVVIDESPVGEPSDFVKLRVTEIRR